ncbi:MAG: ATP-binding cassette domain-containing protein, partial [Chthonomonadales bacterium]
KKLTRFEQRLVCGYVAPDLMLYPDMTGVENLEFFASLKGVSINFDVLHQILTRVGLIGRGRDMVRGYSSGMRQRLKYAIALLGNPEVLALDEPTANLDSEGLLVVESIVQEWRHKGILIVGTNEEVERTWGDTVISLERMNRTS